MRLPRLQVETLQLQHTIMRVNLCCLMNFRGDGVQSAAGRIKAQFEKALSRVR